MQCNGLCRRTCGADGAAGVGVASPHHRTSAAVVHGALGGTHTDVRCRWRGGGVTRGSWGVGLRKRADARGAQGVRRRCFGLLCRVQGHWDRIWAAARVRARVGVALQVRRVASPGGGVRAIPQRPPHLKCTAAGASAVTCDGTVGFWGRVWGPRAAMFPRGVGGAGAVAEGPPGGLGGWSGGGVREAATQGMWVGGRDVVERPYAAGGGGGERPGVLFNNSASLGGGGGGRGGGSDPPHPLLSDGANFSPGLRPIKNLLWRLWRRSV